LKENKERRGKKLEKKLIENKARNVGTNIAYTIYYP